MVSYISVFQSSLIDVRDGGDTGDGRDTGDGGDIGNSGEKGLGRSINIVLML